MKRLALTALVIAYFGSTCAWAQGVKDPSTPDRSHITVVPSQQSTSPNATNVPNQVAAPPVGRYHRAQPYYGSTTRGAGSVGRR
ncbi:hypothetical protein ES707_07205 [subsurface metagenome]